MYSPRGWDCAESKREIDMLRDFLQCIFFSSCILYKLQSSSAHPSGCGRSSDEHIEETEEEPVESGEQEKEDIGSTSPGKEVAKGLALAIDSLTLKPQTFYLSYFEYH